jgi:hypothetical protein
MKSVCGGAECAVEAGATLVSEAIAGRSTGDRQRRPGRGAGEKPAHRRFSDGLACRLDVVKGHASVGADLPTCFGAAAAGQDVETGRAVWVQA